MICIWYLFTCFDQSFNTTAATGGNVDTKSVGPQPPYINVVYERASPRGTDARRCSVYARNWR